MDKTEIIKALVKEALKEIEQDKYHEGIHSKIQQQLAKEVPIGKSGVTQCSLCRKLFTVNKPDLVKAK